MKTKRLYTRLQEQLVEELEKNAEKEVLLPSERELSKRYGISRTTVRAALNEMERQGVVCRKHGKGTFAVIPDIFLQKQAVIFSENQCFSFNNKQLSIGLLGLETIEADKYLADCLDTRIGTKLIAVTKGSGTKVPFIVEKIYLLKSRFTDSNSALELISSEKAYHYLLRQSFMLVKAVDEYCSIRVLREAEFRLLDFPVEESVLSIQQFFYDGQRRIGFSLTVAQSGVVRQKWTASECGFEE